MKMRIISVKFVCSEGKAIEFVNVEDWMIQIFVAGKDLGCVLCPKQERKTVANPERTMDAWVERMVNVVEAEVKFVENEKEWLTEDLSKMLDCLV